MSSNNYSNGFNKYYGTSDTYIDIEIYTIRCRDCGRLVKAEHNFKTNDISTFELVNYPNHRIEHPHPADVVTTTDLTHQTAIEIRYIRRPNRDDRRYLMDNRRRVFSLN